MKNPFFNAMKPFVFAIGVALANQIAFATQMVGLGDASGFAVLAGSGITVAGPANSTAITGDIGSWSTVTETGLGNVALSGVNHAGDAVTQQAKIDLGQAYNDAMGRAPTTTFTAVHDLGNATLAGGVYNDPSSFGITGILTLDGAGDPNAVWIFQAGSSLTTAASSQIILTGGAQASHVFWAVGSSATLGTDSDFIGTVMAFSDINGSAGANVQGRLLALNGTVSLDANTVIVGLNGTHGSVPDTGGTLLFCAVGFGALCLLRHSLKNLNS